MPTTPDDAEIRQLTGFLHEAGHLKRTKRAGWWIAGVKDPESVAEHSFRAAVVGYVIALLEGVDAERTATLCLFHDVAEVRLGDVPSTGRQFVTTAPAADVVAVQTAGLPEAVSGPIRDVVAEFDGLASHEALCANDADKLECLLQAREYQVQGVADVQPWIDTMQAAVRTAAGQRLAEAARTLPPNQWWYEIAATYGSPATAAAGAWGAAADGPQQWTVDLAEEALRLAKPDASLFVRALVDEGGTATAARLKELTGRDQLHYMTLSLNAAVKTVGGRQRRFGRQLANPRQDRDNPRHPAVYDYAMPTEAVPIFDEALRRLGR